jgi:hypothetical protein
MEPPRKLRIILFGLSIALLLVILATVAFTTTQDSHAELGLFLIGAGVAWLAISAYIGVLGILISIYWVFKDRSCAKVTKTSLILNLLLLGTCIFIYSIF